MQNEFFRQTGRSNFFFFLFCVNFMLQKMFLPSSCSRLGDNREHESALWWLNAAEGRKGADGPDSNMCP